MLKIWIRYIGKRWRDFKKHLTSDYITDPNGNMQTPYLMYPFISETIWERMRIEQEISTHIDCLVKDMVNYKR